MEEKAQSERAAPPPRRRFLRKIWLILGGVALAELARGVVAFLGYRPDKRGGDDAATVSAGNVEDYDRNSVTPFPRAAFYLVRLEDGGFMALSRWCTHQGCTVAWSDRARRFVCPCHSSAFDISGAVIAPPAPRALDFYRLRIENDALLVDTRQAVKRALFDRAQVVYPQKNGTDE